MTTNQEKTATFSAINAYAVLVLSFIGLKTAFTKDMMDFLPVLLSVFLLILNNSVKYYNRVPAVLAFFITIGQVAFFAMTDFRDMEILDLVRYGIMILLGLVSMVLFIPLFKEKEF